MPPTRIILLLLTLSFLVAGVAEPLTPATGGPASIAGLVHSFIIAILCFSWCKADAAVRNVNARGGAVFAALLPPIGLPVYFFRTRPTREAFLSCVKALLFFLLSVGLFAAGFYVALKFSGEM